MSNGVHVAFEVAAHVEKSRALAKRNVAASPQVVVRAQREKTLAQGSSLCHRHSV
jgi:hypothetical protein